MEDFSQGKSDQELIELAKTNPDIFGPLVNRYWRRLFLFAKRTSFFSNEDIEDILQETFLKIYKSLNDFDSSLSFSTWAYHICRNTIIDAIRRKQARPKTVYMDETDAVNLFRDATDMARHLESKERYETVVSIIQSLPEKYREVLVLRFLEEKNYEEIMDIVEKPKGTVASLVNRGRKLLMDEARQKGLLDQSIAETISNH